ncbi:MAG: GatB/YqeY domain-containing protein [Deltaproteobacteria bacterium]|nr:GatB/YqeY domain-containing protein [Deltaproteobacteria bacterium]
MTLRERLDADLKDAMRAKDQLRLDVVRAVKSAIKYREVEGDKAVVLDEATILQVVGTEIKKRRDAAEQFRAAAREELARKEEAELVILQAYLPAQLSPEELARKVDEAIARTGAKGPKDMGAVMKALMPEVQGKADGKAVSELVKQKLAPR